MATILFHVLAGAGMAAVAWWLWRDEDYPGKTGADGRGELPVRDRWRGGRSATAIR